MKKLILSLNIILIISVIALDILQMIFGGLALKAAASVFFMLAGGLNLLYALKLRKSGCEIKLAFPIIMLLGIVFAMSADIAIYYDFISGAALFAIGHILYFISYCTISQFAKKDIIPQLLVFAVGAGLILLLPILDFGGELMKAVSLIYALILSVMTGKAVSFALTDKSRLSLTIAVGSVLFFVSDAMLLIHIFSDIPRIFEILCLSTYYPAQCFLAAAIYVYDKQYEQRKG